MSISPPNYNNIPSRKKHDIPEGVVLYSPVTEIYYKKVKGVVEKYGSMSWSKPLTENYGVFKAEIQKLMKESVA